MRHREDHSGQPLISRFRVFTCIGCQLWGLGFVSAGHREAGDHGPLSPFNSKPHWPRQHGFWNTLSSSSYSCTIPTNHKIECPITSPAQPNQASTPATPEPCDTRSIGTRTGVKAGSGQGRMHIPRYLPRLRPPGVRVPSKTPRRQYRHSVDGSGVCLMF